MSRIRRNILANALGRGWSMVLGVAILPLYVRFLGAEAYGLVGLYASIAVICSLFDAGITASLGRELARTSATVSAHREMGELVRTAELLYGGIGILLGGTISLAAPLIVMRWLRLKNLDVIEAIAAVRLMGGYFVFQWTLGLYMAGLAGLQRQVELNVISSLGTTLRAGGTVVVLWKVSANIVAFYWWQIVATFLYVLVSREVLWRSPGLSRRTATFKWSVVTRVREFAGGVTLLSLVSVASSQLDKVVLTRMVSLESFGYYSFACSVAGAVTFFGQPIMAAIYPAMIEAHARGENIRLSSLFHRAAQLVSVAIFAPGAVLCAFSPIVLRLWARDPSTANNASTLVSACLVGAALNGAALMPYNLTLAAARVRPAMIAASSGVLIYAAVLLSLTTRFGVLAGAIGNAIVNLFGLLVYAFFCVRLQLPGEAWRWLVVDVTLPLVASGLVAAAIRWLASAGTTMTTQAVGLLVASLAVPLGAAVITPFARQELAVRLRALKLLKQS